jgi:hypothetical protein
MEQERIPVFNFEIDASLMGEVEENARHFGKEVADLAYDEAATVVIGAMLKSFEGMETGTFEINGRTAVDIEQDGQQAFEGFASNKVAEQLILRVQRADEIVISVMRNKKVWERGKRIRKKVADETYRYQNNLRSNE